MLSLSNQCPPRRIQDHFQTFVYKTLKRVLEEVNHQEEFNDTKTAIKDVLSAVAQPAQPPQLYEFLEYSEDGQITLKDKPSLDDLDNPYLKLFNAAYPPSENISKTFEEMLNRYFLSSYSQPSTQIILEIQSLINNHPDSLVIVQRWLTQQRDHIVATLTNEPNWRLKQCFEDRLINFLGCPIDSLPLSLWLLWFPAGEKTGEELLGHLFEAMGPDSVVMYLHRQLVGCSHVAVLPSFVESLLLSSILQPSRSRESDLVLFRWIVEAYKGRGGTKKKRRDFLISLKRVFSKEAGSLQKRSVFFLLAREKSSPHHQSLFLDLLQMADLLDSSRKNTLVRNLFLMSCLESDTPGSYLFDGLNPTQLKSLVGMWGKTEGDSFLYLLAKMARFTALRFFKFANSTRDLLTKLESMFEQGDPEFKEMLRRHLKGYNLEDYVGQPWIWFCVGPEETTRISKLLSTPNEIFEPLPRIYSFIAYETQSEAGLERLCTDEEMRDLLWHSSTNNGLFSQVDRIPEQPSVERMRKYLLSKIKLGPVEIARWMTICKSEKDLEWVAFIFQKDKKEVQKIKDSLIKRDEQRGFLPVSYLFTTSEGKDLLFNPKKRWR
ncbi:hypothetical protein CbuRSA425_07455 [Coxiella burnetii]|nr:hypothetical protein B7L74_07495 [Coxiella burnetii]ARK27686.1 hypothetical protein BMW92_07290 [Coxiella burnetii]OYK84102.1 hypothetical protein CbuRSA315_07455 [Coxiella burnetii]OYK87919.1 hypothetical protein CbuRSA345_07455 [Coxiella burnetii]OYK90876.1 hypothetical protein CbuRSA338_07465 [Coxiella burnetii]